MRPADMSRDELAGIQQSQDVPGDVPGDASADSSAAPADAPRVPHVGTYHRRLPVSLERMYENAIDWEHLPFLHSGSFCDIECDEAGDWGWRATAGLVSGDGREQVRLQLLLDRKLRRWITTTLEGPGQGGEIWTHVFELGEREIEINVDFFVPGVAAKDAPLVGQIYSDLYAGLYDEDEWMMTERQKQLDAIATGGPDRMELGPADALRHRLPYRFELAGRPYSLVEMEGELRAFCVQCPHMLGPLPDTADEDGIVACPWHDYRFNILSGENVGRNRCRLAPAPELQLDENGIITASLASR